MNQILQDVIYINPDFKQEKKYCSVDHYDFVCDQQYEGMSGVLIWVTNQKKQIPFKVLSTTNGSLILTLSEQICDRKAGEPIVFYNCSLEHFYKNYYMGAIINNNQERFVLYLPLLEESSIPSGYSLVKYDDILNSCFYVGQEAYVIVNHEPTLPIKVLIQLSTSLEVRVISFNKYYRQGAPLYLNPTTDPYALRYSWQKEYKVGTDMQLFLPTHLLQN